VLVRIISDRKVCVRTEDEDLIFPEVTSVRLANAVLEAPVAGNKMPVVTGELLEVDNHKAESPWDYFARWDEFKQAWSSIYETNIVSSSLCLVRDGGVYCNQDGKAQ